MAKGAYVGIDGKARKIKKGYVGVAEVARKIKKAYIGIGGVARPCWGGGLEYYGAITPLSYARNSLAAAHVGNYAIFAGGVYVNGSGRLYYTYVDAYDASLTKTTPTSLNGGGYTLAATSVGNYALFGGGQYSNTSGSTTTYSAYVNAYDASLVRTLAPNLDNGRRWLAAATANNCALFGGGYNDDTGSFFTKVDIYNASLTKETSQTLSMGRRQLAAAAVGTHALFAGGSLMRR